MRKDQLLALLDNSIPSHMRRELSRISELEQHTLGSAWRAYEEECKRQRKMIQDAFGPIQYTNDLIRQLHLNTFGIESIINSAKAYEDMFKLPRVAEVNNLIGSAYGLSKLGLASEQFGATALIRAAEQMHTPWMRLDDMKGSLSGFVGIQSMGQLLRDLKPFEDVVSFNLRDQLGDWRNTIEFDDVALLDIQKRSDFYRSQGFNEALTDFPTEAFEESIEIAGLNDSYLVDSSSEQHLSEVDSEQEAGFLRTNAAHNRLMRFETKIRNFIVDRMHAQYGESWIKQRVPGDILKRWLAKQDKAREESGEEGPLITFADFGDYVQIITRSDNWEIIFAQVFKRQESVRESFNRLSPLRNCTMHARLISLDDELYLLVETKRLLQAITRE